MVISFNDDTLINVDSKLGWKLGLQSVTGALSLAFFLGLIYRSAALYHPQRRAILHLKNQRSKVKEKRSSSKAPRQPLVDLSPLGCRPVRMLMLAAGAAGFGLYTPAFYIVSYENKKIKKRIDQTRNLWVRINYPRSKFDSIKSKLKIRIMCRLQRN